MQYRNIENHWLQNFKVNLVILVSNFKDLWKHAPSPVRSAIFYM